MKKRIWLKDLIFNIIFLFKIALVSVVLFGCSKANLDKETDSDVPIVDNPGIIDYSVIPQSDFYEVSVISENKIVKQTVFKSTCPDFEQGKQAMIAVDKFPLEIFSGRSISWTSFSFSGSITVEVKVLKNISFGSAIKILPSRQKITPIVNGNVIRFTISNPGQFSVEIGENGYKQGLLIFADPKEIEIPKPLVQGYKIFKHESSLNINSIGSSFSGIYFEKGIHNIGVYSVPPNIKNIYLEQGSWVYGALIMDGNSNVKIFGRGVLSAAKLNYRESHSIEAKNQSDNIQVEGIVIADQKHFAIRLIGINNTVKWIKTIGGWVYNTDGIAAFGGSQISNCFIWANDDSIKVYRNDITISDCVVWQLNNGAVIQMGWTAPNSENVKIQRIDVLRTEYNKDRFNVGILNYVGNSYKEPDKTGYHKNWLIEDVVTETPTQIVFNITPDQFSTSILEGMSLRNWNVKMDLGFQNRIIGNNPNNYFKGLVFDNVIFNGIKLDAANWINTTGIVLGNLETPLFK
jgi:hypothetical protein